MRPSISYFAVRPGLTRPCTGSTDDDVDCTSLFMASPNGRAEVVGGVDAATQVARTAGRLKKKRDLNLLQQIVISKSS